MPNTMGPAAGTQKETIYGGPSPNGGTVNGGTVYQGPGLNGEAADNSRWAQVARAQQQAGRVAGRKIFFTIAALSALNTVLIALKAPLRFAVGLAATRISVDGQLGPVLVMNAIAIGLFVGLGFATTKGSKAAFIIGMVLYASDTVFMLFSPASSVYTMSLIVHAVFLYSMVKVIRRIV
jgi:hypothetical protein